MSRSLWSDYESIGALAAGVIKASPGEIFSFFARNKNAAVRYVQLFDSPTAPTNGATPKAQWDIPAGGGGEIVIGTDFFTDDGVGFNTGISWGISTTDGTFTAATASDHVFMAVYG
jgi:hypothetical protein